jgi:ABC-type glycerol-3-phosphate transport system permease component
MASVQVRPVGRRASRIFRPSTIRGRERGQQVAVLVVLCLGAVVMVAPFAWMIATAFDFQANISMPATPSFLPREASWGNFENALQNTPVVHQYLNSVVVAVASTLGYLFFSSLTGYAFAKGRFRGKTFFFIAFLATLLVPFETRMIPLYLMMNRFGLDNSLTALVLPFVVGGFGTFLMRQAMSTVPDDLIHAARIDGASEFRIFWSIVLPLCKPTLAALTIINVLWRWNDVLWPTIVNSDPDVYTITQGLAASHSQATYTGVALATATLAVVPMLLVYVLLQRFIVRGVASSGIKG